MSIEVNWSPSALLVNWRFFLKFLKKEKEKEKQDGGGGVEREEGKFLYKSLFLKLILIENFSKKQGD